MCLRGNVSAHTDIGMAPTASTLGVVWIKSEDIFESTLQIIKCHTYKILCSGDQSLEFPLFKD